MICGHCGAENKAGRSFCSQCGHSLSAICPDCGYENDQNDRFCGGCGGNLEPGTTPNTAKAAATSTEPGSEPKPRPELKDNVIDEKSPDPSRQAEKRQLTVMFCDLVDSTAMSTRMDPEDLSQLNQLYQQTCSSIIEELGGYIARYMGDGILCYFGYPRAHENDAERSIHAALRIQSRITEINEEGLTSELMSVRIGIATGPVIVGEVVGSGAARESTAVGKTPNLAARLQSLAQPGKIVIASETRTLAGSRFELTNIGQHHLKGIDTAVDAWEVVCVSSNSSRFEARGSQKLTAFVGRKHERALLEDCFEQATNRHGQIVMLCGEPGIGKSRLIQFAMDLSSDSVITLQCSPHHQNSSLYPLIEYLRSVQKQNDDASGSWIKSLLEQSGISDPDAPGLIDKLVNGTTRYNISIPGLPLQKQRTMELVSDILLQSGAEKLKAGGGAVIVVIEDLHWIDHTTQELLNSLVFNIADQAALLLFSFRPEFIAPWVGPSHVHLLNLNRISNEQCYQMILTLLGPQESGELARQIVERTDGIPLFVEELTQTLMNARQLNLSGDQSFEIPATLADSLNARLDNLGSARRTAQAAAVIGRDFGFSVLEAVTQSSKTDLEKEIGVLVDSGLAYRMNEDDGGNFRFKHALIQDAAYSSLLRDRKSRFHKRAAEFLTASAEAEGRLAGLISYHYMLAGDQISALRFARVAGEYFLSTHAITEAKEHFDKAAELLSLPESSAQVSGEELAIHIGTAACFRMQENYDDALESLAHAETIASEIGDIKALADICHTRGNIYFPLARRDEILEQHTRALNYARQLNSPELEARSVGGLGDAYYLRGEMQSATRQFSECCRISEENGFIEFDAVNRPMIGWSRIYQLEFSEAKDDAVKALELAKAHGIYRGEMNAQALLGFVYAELMEPELSKKHAAISMDMAERIGSLNFRAAFVVFANRAMDEISDRKEMYKMAKEAAETSRQYGQRFHGPGILGGLLLVSDDPNEREQIIAEAEAELKKGCVSHNYFWFYQFAMQSAINNREWDWLEHFRKGLAFYDPEPRTLWSTFFIHRSRCLESYYRDRVTEAVEKKRLELIAICNRHSMLKSVRELEAVAT